MEKGRIRWQVRSAAAKSLCCYIVCGEKDKLTELCEFSLGIFVSNQGSVWELKPHRSRHPTAPLWLKDPGPWRAETYLLLPLQTIIRVPLLLQPSHRAFRLPRVWLQTHAFLARNGYSLWRSLFKRNHLSTAGSILTMSQLRASRDLARPNAWVLGHVIWHGMDGRWTYRAIPGICFWRRGLTGM